MRFYNDSLCWRCFPWSSNQKSYPHKCRKALTFTCLFLISCVCLDFFVSALVLVPDGADQPGYAAVWLGVCLMWNTDSFCPASFDKRQCQVDTKKTSSTTQTRDEPQSSMASMSLQEWPSLNQIFMYNLTGVFCSWPCSYSDMCQIWFDVFFFPPPQLQHCLPVYLLLSRAHSQSSGGTQHHESPPAPHHKLSRPAPPGCPGALFPWSEGCTQEPFWQGETAPKPFTHPNNPFIPPGLKLL